MVQKSINIKKYTVYSLLPTPVLNLPRNTSKNKHFYLLLVKPLYKYEYIFLFLPLLTHNIAFYTQCFLSTLLYILMFLLDNIKSMLEISTT